MPKYQPEEVRFFAKVKKSRKCWIWLGHVNPKGYGKFSRYKGSPVMAHRWSYEYFVGEIPKGLVLDHLCGVKNCVNPEHLEPVTNKENLIRGEVGKKNAEHHKNKTHCRNGHRYSEGTYVLQERKTRGVVVRKCLKCYDKQQQRHKDKRP